MSIKKAHCQELKLKLLSKTKEDLINRISKVRDEMYSLIKGEVWEGYSEEEINAISKTTNFIQKKQIYLGCWFRQLFYDHEAVIYPSISSISTMIEIKFPGTYPTFNWDVPDLRESKRFPEIIQLNERIVSLQERFFEVDKNFDRHINENTSLVWLKKNLPEVYDELKKLQTPS